ncbi:MAG: NTP transferase domain-containing protein [Spirochaetaceae bacterium]|nr:NTP transferase domain-containing protein [Spirochaetaceae bacterium]MCF7948008.1 NTP transferase domain-containing protein [Spirochaetia bacterium]MCF7951108.1 NTP transferase domain-containing protein [Spirochaetaceae bacterium]
MNYICLAAGKGTRFNGLGVYLQKCMYPIGGIPFLRFSIENLISSSVFDEQSDSITLVVGHLSHQIKAYFGTSFKGARIRYVEQGEASGTGHAVLQAYRSVPFSEWALVWLADGYVPTHIFEQVTRSPSNAALTVASHVCEHAHGERVSINSEKTHITRAWQGKSEYVDIGVWKVPVSIMDAMLSHKTDEHRYLPVVEEALQEGLIVDAVRAEEWVHLGGTEPSVIANLKAVTTRLLEEVKDSERT